MPPLLLRYAMICRYRRHVTICFADGRLRRSLRRCCRRSPSFTLQRYESPRKEPVTPMPHLRCLRASFAYYYYDAAASAAMLATRVMLPWRR